MKTKNERIKQQCIIVLFVLMALYGAIWVFTNMWPWEPIWYNSYTLQAQAWIDGRLDLGQNYSHLEIAIFDGKFFVSFPPFPSFIFYILGFVFRYFNFDGWVALISIIVGAFYVIRLLNEMEKKHVVFWTLFLMIASNLVFVTCNGWVWFIAQNMCFTLSIMAIYYAVKGAGGWAFFYWACSIGCRPFQIIYFPFLFYIVYTGWKKQNLESNMWQLFKSKFYWAFPTIAIGCVYMALNYARFGSITEFGHNYLPEFTEAANGQFDLSYIFTNWKNMFRIFTINADGTWAYPKFDGMAIWISMPIYITYGIYLIYYGCKRRLSDVPLIWMHLALMTIQTLSILSHKTLGGWQFGNRYFIDLLPYMFYVMMKTTSDEEDKLYYMQIPLFVFGVVVNFLGTIATYNYWI